MVRCVTHVSYGLGSCCIVLVSLCNALLGQETFELSAPGIGQSSIAKLDAHELVIRDGAGQTTRYERLPRYDTADQQFISYASRAAQQVILWPASNQGRMQIGTLQNGRIEFSVSKMTVKKLAVPARGDGSGNTLMPRGPFRGTDDPFGPGLGDPSNAAADFARARTASRGRSVLPPGVATESFPVTAIQLAAGEQSERLYLASTASGRIDLESLATNANVPWYVVPVGNEMVRVQYLQNNRWYALGLDDEWIAATSNQGIANPFGISQRGAMGIGGFPRGGAFGAGAGFGNGNARSGAMIQLRPIQYAVKELWVVHPIPQGGYCFESVLYPGFCLAAVPGSGLILQPINNGPWQTWWAQQQWNTLPVPQYRTVDHRVIPDPPLPPVTARLVNTHTETLYVILTDRRNPGQPRKLRIPAGRSESVQLDRDSGATIVETVEIMDLAGNWNREEYQTPIPPKVLYDVSVYEEFLQSIAIDRTGTSPTAIEDVNYQPRSIGYFLIPPGDTIQNFSEIDLYAIADGAKNPGAVRRLDSRDLPKSSSSASPADPLKDLLDQFQRKRAAF